MDTSEQCIKMCEKAEEIQALLSQNKGDISPQEPFGRNQPYPTAWIYESDSICSSCGNELESPYCPSCGGKSILTNKGFLQMGGPSERDLKEARIVWLPHQDQLQEMVDWEVDGKRFDDLLFMVEAIQAFASIKMTNAFPTWEQLWLAFVMSEKYNKVWDGKDWVKA